MIRTGKDGEKGQLNSGLAAIPRVSSPDGRRDIETCRRASHFPASRAGHPGVVTPGTSRPGDLAPPGVRRLGVAHPDNLARAVSAAGHAGQGALAAAPVIPEPAALTAAPGDPDPQ